MTTEWLSTMSLIAAAVFHAKLLRFRNINSRVGILPKDIAILATDVLSNTDTCTFYGAPVLCWCLQQPVVFHRGNLQTCSSYTCYLVIDLITAQSFIKYNRTTQKLHPLAMSPLEPLETHSLVCTGHEHAAPLISDYFQQDE